MQSEYFVFRNSVSLLVLIALLYSPLKKKWTMKLLLALSKLLEI